jgi:predicted nucleic acid-binding protein
MELVLDKNVIYLAGFSLKVKKNLRVIRGTVNPKLLCNSKILRRRFLSAPRNTKVCQDSPLEPR